MQVRHGSLHITMGPNECDACAEASSSASGKDAHRPMVAAIPHEHQCCCNHGVLANEPSGNPAHQHDHVLRFPGERSRSDWIDVAAGSHYCSISSTEDEDLELFLGLVQGAVKHNHKVMCPRVHVRRAPRANECV